MSFKSKVSCLTSLNPLVFPSGNWLGTNCYIIGTGPMRALFDTGSGNKYDPTFAPRLKELMSKENFQISKIFLSQAKAFHCGGTLDVSALQKSEPVVYKKLNSALDSKFLASVKLAGLKDKKRFEIEEGLALTAIETPGH